MKFSYVTLPDYPLTDSIEMMETADELGFHARYTVDETWHKDMYMLLATGADKTMTYIEGENPVTEGRNRR
jgi:5,10-methylenetetrahydromethanopterin reductase